MATSFKGAKGMTISGQGVYFTPGVDCILRIEKTHIFPARKGDMYIVEGVIVEGGNAEHPVGARRSWLQGLKDKDIAFRAVKAFCIAALGLSMKRSEDDKKIAQFEEECETVLEASAVENIFKGHTVRLETTNKPTRAGQDFTLHVWSPADTWEKKAA